MAEESQVANLPPVKRPIAVHRTALTAGLIALVVMAALVGWLGFRAYEAHQVDARRNLFVDVARQGAVNLTTIDYEHSDADVQRILDSSTGNFRDSFSQRWRPFVDRVKRERSNLVGTVDEAGLESQSGDVGQVLVAVTVRSAQPGEEDREPQVWRMRITVQKVGHDGKLSNVVLVS